VTGAIKIDGLAQFVRNLRKLDSDLPKALRVGFNTAGQIIVDEARPHMPSRSGRARSSLAVRSTTGGKARVQLGGRKAPYAPWLDFGGRVGPARSVLRPYLKDGRYVWKALAVRRDDVHAALHAALLDAARGAGVEVE